MRNVLSYLVILVVTFTITACGGGYTAVEDDIVVESYGGLAGGDVDTSGDVSTSGLDSGSSLNALDLGDSGSVDDTNLLNRRVIYFDYDSSNLTLESEAIVHAHARHLNSMPEVEVTLEGHTDERGTREYNLALGENRAKAVFTVMQAVGISSERIQIISYGEERPVSLSSDEGAWNLNRRVEILY